MGKRLEDKTAVITGACSGIGRSIADAFVAEGANVAIFDVQEEKFEAIEAALGDDVLTCACDVSDADEIKEAVDQTLDRWDSIDVVVNNAGVIVRDTVESITDDEMELVFEVDLKGVIRVARATMPALRETAGTMINVSSVAAETGSPGLCTYSAAKGGVSSLTRQLAVDYGGDDVTINAIAPGTVKTPANEQIRDQDNEWAENIAANVPLGRLADPPDVTGPVVFLASDEASYITGQVLVIDGGRSVASR